MVTQSALFVRKILSEALPDTEEFASLSNIWGDLSCFSDATIAAHLAAVRRDIARSRSGQIEILHDLRDRLAARGVAPPPEYEQFKVSSIGYSFAREARPDLDGAALEAYARELEYLNLVNSGGAEYAARALRAYVSDPRLGGEVRRARAVSRPRATARGTPRMRLPPRARRRAPRRHQRSAVRLSAVASAGDGPPEGEPPSPPARAPRGAGRCQ